MTKTKKRMQNGGVWPFDSNSTPADTINNNNNNNNILTKQVSAVVSPTTSSVEGLPSPDPTKEKTFLEKMQFWKGGSHRRRRRCTKKHRHSSACKRMRKGKRTKGRKRR